METRGQVIGGLDKIVGKEPEDTTTAAGEKLQAKLDAIRVENDITPDTQTTDGEFEINEANKELFEFLPRFPGRSSQGDQHATYFRAKLFSALNAKPARPRNNSGSRA